MPTGVAIASIEKERVHTQLATLLRDSARVREKGGAWWQCQEYSVNPPLFIFYFIFFPSSKIHLRQHGALIYWQRWKFGYASSHFHSIFLPLFFKKRNKKHKTKRLFFFFNSGATVHAWGQHVEWLCWHVLVFNNSEKEAKKEVDFFLLLICMLAFSLSVSKSFFFSVGGREKSQPKRTPLFRAFTSFFSSLPHSGEKKKTRESLDPDFLIRSFGHFGLLQQQQQQRGS